MAFFKKSKPEEPQQPKLHLYTPKELEKIEAHITAQFGAFPNVIHEIVSPDIHLDIAVVPPTEERNFYTLVTMGMGAYEMEVPQALKSENLSRAELLICLPPDWRLGDQAEEWYWPVRWLKNLARLPLRENSWLGWGHTVPVENSFAPNTKLCGMLLAAPGPFGKDAQICILPSGEWVRFYQLLPVYQEEMDFKEDFDTQHFLARLDDDFPFAVDINRKNYCEGYTPQEEPEKQFVIPVEDIRPLLKWDGPQGCIATDRIMTDGLSVGYFFREAPVDDQADSGWRFFAGDEDADYLSSPARAGFYPLNVLCNYDREIMPYLSAPVGSAFMRNENGAIIPDPAGPPKPAEPDGEPASSEERKD